MTVYIFTPEVLKDQIDKLAKDKGFKFFIMSSEKDGTALAPSKKKQFYRLPIMMPDDYVEGKMNLNMMLRGHYLIGMTDPSVLNEEAFKEYEKAVEREKELCQKK